MTTRLLRCIGLATALACATPALAQVPLAPPATLPGASDAASRLPSAGDTRLPGVDPRQCGTSIHAALCAHGRWADFATIEMKLKAAQFDGTYTMERPLNGETHTTYREQWPQGRRGGEIVFVSEDAFAYRSREPFSDNNVILDEMMTAPNMFAQLAAVLLDQSARIGPAEVTGRPLDLSAGSETQFVRTEAPSSAALYGPPWKVTGTLRASAPKTLKFSLRFTFRPVDTTGRVNPAQSETIELAGTFSYGNRRSKMPDSFDLVGWKLVKAGDALGAVATLAEARSAVGAP